MKPHASTSSEPVPERLVQAHGVAQWLRTLPRIRPGSVVPVLASFRERAFYSGACYIAEHTSIYLVGERPSSKRESVCFAKGEETWFTALYYVGPVSPHQPFGSNFILQRWEDGEPIDHWSTKPYRRIPLLITPVT